MIRIDSKLGGRIREVRVIKASGEVIEHPGFPNLVTDTGVDYLCSSSTAQFISGCRYGSGTGTLDEGNDGLFNLEASTTSTYQSDSTAVGEDAAGYWAAVTRYFNFPPSPSPVNVTEFGLTDSLPGTNIFTHAFVLDGAGGPTSIALDTGDALQIAYTVRAYLPDESLWQGEVDGVERDVIIRPGRHGDRWASFYHGLGMQSAMQAYSGEIQPIDSFQPGGPLGGTASSSPLPYSPGDFYRDIAYSWGASQANGNIASITTAPSATTPPGGHMQLGISPPLVKTSGKLINLTIRRSWSRL